MDESEKNPDFEIQGLSLIDVSFEDDCLINSSSSFISPLNHSFSENQEQKSIRSMASFDSSNGESPFKPREETDKELQPLDSPELETTGKSGKYNLRKSLAWDNAFFTSEGFLEPEELSSMMGCGGTGKSAKLILPGIQEDALSRRSTDSLSTLESDTLTMKSREADLFEDIRASIQKSSKMSNGAKSKSNNKLEATESPTTQSSKKADLSSRDKIKLKVAHKKPVVGTQGSGKAIKQVSVCPQSSQSVSTNVESTAFICKPPKVLGKVSPHTTISTKRASLTANRVKMEKDNPKISSVAIRGAAASKTPSSGSRNILPRPTLPSRSVRSSVATKKEITSSRSSFDSSGSASSDISRLSMNSIKQRNDPGTCSPSSGSSSIVKSRSRIASKSNIQSGSSLRSVNKLSPSISPASSISEWSSGSPASKSTVNQVPKNMRVSPDCRSVKGLSVDSDPLQILGSPCNFMGKCSVGDDAKAPSHGDRVEGTSTGIAALRPPAKPSGLRMPSPKIGFFDGVRSSVRTPNGGSMQSHPSLLSALSKHGAGGISPSGGGSNKAKLGKLQPARTAMAMKSTKPDVHHAVLNIKARSSLPLQEPSNATTKVPNPSKNIKGARVSPKLKKSVPATIGGLTSSKDEQVVCTGHQNSPPGFGLSEKNGIPNVSNDTMYSESKDKAHAPGIKSSPVSEQLNALCNSGFNSDVENINPSQKASGDVNSGQNIPKNEKEETQFKYQVGGPTQDEVRDIHVVAEKTVILPSPESILTENS